VCTSQAWSWPEIRAIAAEHHGTCANLEHNSGRRGFSRATTSAWKASWARSGSCATIPRRFVGATRREEEAPLPDLVAQDFAPRGARSSLRRRQHFRPHQQGFGSLATVADLGLGRIVGFAARMPDDLLVEAIEAARGSLTGAVLHGDRASQ